MDVGSGNQMTVLIVITMTVSSNLTKKMGKVCSSGRTVMSIKELIQMICEMGLVS